MQAIALGVGDEAIFRHPIEGDVARVLVIQNAAADRRGRYQSFTGRVEHVEHPFASGIQICEIQVTAGIKMQAPGFGEGSGRFAHWGDLSFVFVLQ